MKRPPVILTAAFLAAGYCSGCSHIPFFGKKTVQPGPPKEGRHVATDTERDFKVRWVDRRSAELVSQGMPAEGARAQATAEFDRIFSATHAAHE